MVVDYARTRPKASSTSCVRRASAPADAAVHVVFGCGGDRDPDKRAPMGAVAATYADTVTITSDNPRA